MVRRRLQGLLMTAAVLAAAGTATAADAPKKDAPIPRGFYQKWLAPTMASRLTGEADAAKAYTDPAANDWTKDRGTVGRIEKAAENAMTGAMKQYALHGLHIDTWLVTLGRAHGMGGGAVPTGSSGGTRVRFGISHLTPRADVLIPSARGNVVFSADARGRLATSFVSHSSNFDVQLSFDTPERSGSFSLVRRF